MSWNDLNGDHVIQPLQPNRALEQLSKQVISFGFDVPVSPSRASLLQLLIVVSSIFILGKIKLAASNLGTCVFFCHKHNAFPNGLPTGTRPFLVRRASPRPSCCSLWWYVPCCFSIDLECSLWVQAGGIFQIALSLEAPCLYQLVFSCSTSAKQDRRYCSSRFRRLLDPSHPCDQSFDSSHPSSQISFHESASSAPRSSEVTPFFLREYREGSLGRGKPLIYYVIALPP